LHQDQIKDALLSLLESEIFKTTAQLVEELRMEYPSLWKSLELEGEKLYGQSCSSLQQPATRIAQVLLSLPDNYCLREKKGKLYFWSKP
jgi:hypothetical protein